MLLAYGRHERTWDEVRALAERIVLDDRIEEWFSALVGVTHGQHADRARRLTAMRIAVAVFDGLPRHIAEGAAEGLAVRMAMPPDPPGDAIGAGQVVLPRTGPRGIDPDEAVTLLDTTPIKVAPGVVPYFARTVPGESISYVDDRLPSAVLRCVWYNHYPLRAPVMAWLGDLALDSRQQVRYRAAQAAGLLCALDYTHTLDALVVPAAKAAAEPDATASDTDADEDEDEDDNEDEGQAVSAQAVRCHRHGPRRTGPAAVPVCPVHTPEMATWHEPGAAVDGGDRLRLRHRRPQPRSGTGGAQGARHPLGDVLVRRDEAQGAARRAGGLPRGSCGNPGHVRFRGAPRGVGDAAQVGRRRPVLDEVAGPPDDHFPDHDGGVRPRRARGRRERGSTRIDPGRMPSRSSTRPTATNGRGGRSSSPSTAVSPSCSASAPT